MDCSTVGLLSFLHVKVSGGEPREVQFSVREKPTAAITVDDNGVSKNGAAM